MKKLQPKKEAYRKISLDKIVMTGNVRTRYNELGIIELAESIRMCGLLEPIIVEERESDYIITAGHRRFKAVQYLYEVKKMEGFFEIECIVKSVKNRIAVQLIENIQREDLTDSELETAIKELIKNGYKQKEIAQQLGKSESWISNIIAAGKTRNEHRSEHGDIDKLSTGAVQEIARIPKEKQADAIKQTIKKGGTVKAAREVKKTHGVKHSGKKTVSNDNEVFNASSRSGKKSNSKVTCPHCGKEIRV